MTLSEWQADPELAGRLKEALNAPIIKAAMEIIKELSMAKSMNGPALLQITNSRECFGYDVGRASVFKDLETLSEDPSKNQKQPKPNYKD